MRPKILNINGFAETAKFLWFPQFFCGNRNVFVETAKFLWFPQFFCGNRNRTNIYAKTA